MQDIYVRDHGTGQPVILIHGFGSSSTQWMFTVPALVDSGYRSLAVDLPGFGQSPLPSEPISTADYAKVVIDFMDNHSIAQAVLVGNSMGGFVSWYLAALYPERVSGLVLSNAVGIMAQPQPDQPRKRSSRLRPSFVNSRWFRALIASPISMPLTRLLVRPILKTTYGDPSRLTPEVLEAMHLAARQASIVFHNRLRWHGLSPEQGEALVSRVRCPVLLIWGDKDSIVPISTMDFFAVGLPHAQTTVYPGVGHVPMLEVPVEFNNDLLQFLRLIDNP